MKRNLLLRIQVCANAVCDTTVPDEAVDNKFNINPQFSSERATDLNKLVSKFRDVFSDNPRRTDTIPYDY